MTSSALTTATIAARRAPAAGGLNATLVGIELRRVFRNRRTLDLPPS